MIACDFEYYRPDSVQEATDTFAGLDSAGKRPVYYGGGTEIITMCRAGSMTCGAVVDIKGIPECRELGFHGDTLVIGSGVTLTEIDESRKFPALGAAGARVADHTVQCKVTLGGNLAGSIIYREAALPLLLSDATATVAGPGVQRDVPLGDVFTNGRLSPGRGEFLVRVAVDRKYTSAPWFHVKRTKMEEIGYPLLTLVVFKVDGQFRLAVSGMYGYPFRLNALEPELSREDVGQAERVTNALGQLPPGVLRNHEGSAEYRRTVFGKVLADCLAKMEGG